MFRTKITLGRLYVRAILALTVLASLTAALEARLFSDWSSAVRVDPPVSTPANDACPHIAKDDLTLYFFSNRAGGQGLGDLYVTHRDSVFDPWDTPQNLGPTINGPSQEFCPATTANGHWLFFTSDRPDPSACGGLDLYASYRRNKRDDFGWEAPVNLGCSVNSAFLDLRPSFQEGGDEGESGLYFNSNRPGGLGGNDIYFSALSDDGTFALPVVVSELSSIFEDLRPTVRKDGLEIVFDSTRTGTLGSTDFWVSTRERITDPWSTPVHLGPEVNSAGTEGGASISFDRKTLYFMSTGFGSLGQNDIYRATRTKVHRSRRCGHDEAWGTASEDDRGRCG
jgi:WD40-like Beta Propeller Repeat